MVHGADDSADAQRGGGVPREDEAAAPEVDPGRVDVLHQAGARGRGRGWSWMEKDWREKTEREKFDKIWRVRRKRDRGVRTTPFRLPLTIT